MDDKIQFTKNGNSFSFKEDIFNNSAASSSYQEAYSKFRLAVASSINTFRGGNQGITPDMLALELQLPEWEDGFVKEVNGVSYIRQKGQWAAIDNKGFGK